jgi:hypothetical protein
VKDLLAAERDAPRPSRMAEERVRARLAASVVAAGAVGVAGAAGATTAAAGATAKAAGAGVLGSAIGVKTSLIAVAVAAGATVTGGYVLQERRAAEAMARATVTRAHAARRAPAASVVPPPATPVHAPVPALDPAPAGEAPVVERRTVAVARTAIVSPPAPFGLTEENVPIAAALSALARGAPSAALASLEQHARRFPAGQLEEEREALWVQALAAAGRADQARSRAERFRRRFPDSIQQDAVTAALAQIR